jgi:hypothetical protein
MNLPYRIDLLSQAGDYILSSHPDWKNAKEKAEQENSWFIPAFIQQASDHIARSFLQRKILEDWVRKYDLPQENNVAKSVGIIMAGNIPMVGFHDLLSVFISGHKAIIKLSSKDNTLIRHLADKMIEWNAETKNFIQFADMLKGCDAYIATGSNHSSRYFEYYFKKYPHIIRRNRTSAAILTGNESTDELEKLADDVYAYFGLGCRNVTKIYVPAHYDFLPLLNSFKKYNHLAEHHKYKNNYDYNLALLILNKKFYMTNGSILLAEDASLFSPIAQLHYEYYDNKIQLVESLRGHPDLQALVGHGEIPFGQAQCPSVSDYADGVDTLSFLKNLG